jgi:hypothetical protein
MSVAEHFVAGAPASSHLFMPDERARRRRIKKEELTELKDTAITKLERRGYEVRGKTPAQIRQILKRHPTRAPAGIPLRSR